MRLESRKEGAFPKLSGRRVSGSCLCGAVELEIDFPAFWAWHDHSAASRRAHGAAYATYIGCWRKHARLAKGQRSIGSLSKRETAAISKPSAKNSINPTARTTTTSEHHNAPVLPAKPFQPFVPSKRAASFRAVDRLYRDYFPDFRQPEVWVTDR